MNPLIERAKRITENINLMNCNAFSYEVRIPDKELITVEQAIIQHKITDFNNLYDVPFENMVLVFKGDVVINEDFDPWLEKQLNGLYWETSLVIILIEGNLTVNGNVRIGDFTHLVINKNLVCKYAESFRGFLEVYGDATIKYGFLGVDYIGRFIVNENLNTPYLLSTGLEEMPLYSDIGEYFYIHIYNDILIKYDNSELEFDHKYSDPFKEEIWKNDFNVELFFEMVRKGENPFMDCK